MPVRPQDPRWKTAGGPSDVAHFIEREFEQATHDRTELQMKLSEIDDREVVYSLWGGSL
jgi:hypothetical protein